MGLSTKSASVKTTAGTVSGRTAEERPAECESAMAQEEDTAERVAEMDRTAQRNESRIRSRAQRTLLGLERRRESRSVAEDRRVRKKVARKRVAWKVCGRNLRESCAEEKKQGSAKDDKVAQRTRCERRQDSAEKQDRAEEDKIVQKTTRSRGRRKKSRGRENRAEE